jgi:glucose-6-phosphate-specific signal transduction histidine kinase
MQMNQKNEIAKMPANDSDPQVDGAGIVRVMILALILLLVGRKFGLAVSLIHFTGAVILAALLYFLWRGLRQFLSHRSGQG